MDYCILLCIYDDVHIIYINHSFKANDISFDCDYLLFIEGKYNIVQKMFRWDGFLKNSSALFKILLTLIRVSHQ